MRGAAAEANIAVMFRTGLALALLTAACGQVANKQPDAGIDGALPPDAVAYHGALAATTPVAFGGSPYCDYTITLKQLTVDLVVIPAASGATVQAGEVEALNVEGNDPTKCTFSPTPENIARYTFAPAAPVAATTAMTFTGAADNAPKVTLTVQLQQAGSLYQANLGFHRTDSADVLNWSIVASVALSQH